jgi:CrcB protein
MAAPARAQAPVTLPNLLLVAAGGAAGSVLRYWLSTLAVTHLGTAFPWGTLGVNVAGSAAIGIAAGLGLQGEARLLLVTGLLGGFTTFSAFSLETAVLAERGWWLAALYVLASVGLGLAAFAVCYAVLKK